MTLVITEQKVTTNGQSSVLVRSSTDGVKVTWSCGTTYMFAFDHALEVLENIKLTAEAFEGTWVNFRDSQAHEFSVKIEDGLLYADRRPSETEAQPPVPWRELRKAVRRSIKQFEEQEQEQDVTMRGSPSFG